MNDRLLVEVCAGSLDDVIEAEAGGANRVELCSALFEGGLTPSLGTLIEAKLRVSIPIVAMIRPRSAGFCYSPAELVVMHRDADLMIEHGADGLVFGVLTADGNLDLGAMASLVAKCQGKQSVCHRAFDVVPDPFDALEQLIDLGITRVLTSGQEETVYNGAALIAKLIDRAAGRIEILPGGGINRFNLPDILARTGTKQIHVSARRPVKDFSTCARPQVHFGGKLYPPEDSHSMADRTAIAALRSADNSR